MAFPVAAFFDRLNAVYRDEHDFVRLKARLLAVFDLLFLAFVPFNILKNFLIHPPELGLRIGFNVVFAFSAWLSLHWVRKGNLERAGNALVLATVIPIHILLFVFPAYPEPINAAIMLFIFDLVILLLALVFASRVVAAVVLLIVITSHVAYHLVVLRGDPIPGSLRFAADTILRDGLITMGFVFLLGLILVRMIEAANRRSVEALRETREMNENLGRLVDERTRDLEAATRRANEASRAKGDFLANMSHEIRTPLNAIIASADLLQHHKDLPTDAAEDARLIADSGDLLLKLIGDILDLSKIEAGQLTLENHTFELSALVNDSIHLLSSKAAQGDVRIQSRIDHDLSKSFEGDSLRLRQILLNLLANAVKFTPAGGVVTLVIESVDAHATPTPARFEVRDTGIGMDESLVKRLFERFSQADASTSRRFGGTGLGLSISSHLVALMGGRLEVESTPELGSVFHFTIPLRAVRTISHVTAEPERTMTPLDLRVLIADDNAINRKILASQLEKLGCHATMAVDGTEALAALCTEPLPDVVMMDCIMPNVDGWEATRSIRGWARDPQASEIQRRAAAIPIVALTAATLPEERALCTDAGMDDFLAKPAKLHDIQRVLQQIVNAIDTARS